jgi:hypothetical protein
MAVGDGLRRSFAFLVLNLSSQGFVEGQFQSDVAVNGQAMRDLSWEPLLPVSSRSVSFGLGFRLAHVFSLLSFCRTSVFQGNDRLLWRSGLPAFVQWEHKTEGRREVFGEAGYYGFDSSIEKSSDTRCPPARAIKMLPPLVRYLIPSGKKMPLVNFRLALTVLFI